MIMEPLRGGKLVQNQPKTLQNILVNLIETINQLNGHLIIYGIKKK